MLAGFIVDCFCELLDHLWLEDGDADEREMLRIGLGAEIHDRVQHHRSHHMHRCVYVA